MLNASLQERGIEYQGTVAGHYMEGRQRGRGSGSRRHMRVAPGMRIIF